MVATTRRRIAVLQATFTLILSLSAYRDGRHVAAATLTAPIVGLPGYQISSFAMGTASYKNPDSIVVDAGHVWVGYITRRVPLRARHAHGSLSSG